MATWNFQNQTVVITGGTGGIGLALTSAFITAGAKVYLCGLNDSRMDEVKAELGSQYESSQYDIQAVDVSNVSELQNWVKGILLAGQGIQVLVNVAGICGTTHASQVT